MENGLGWSGQEVVVSRREEKSQEQKIPVDGSEGRVEEHRMDWWLSRQNWAKLASSFQSQYIHNKFSRKLFNGGSSWYWILIWPFTPLRLVLKYLDIFL